MAVTLSPESVFLRVSLGLSGRGRERPRAEVGAFLRGVKTWGLEALSWEQLELEKPSQALLRDRGPEQHWERP